eukprot:jgi/Ulvmu1/401/UM001_0408.1
MMPVASLKHFILRSEVLKLYRACLRAARAAPSHSRDGALEYLHHSFAIQRHKTDYYDIKYALSDGREQLKKWREMLGMAG